jgi:hypothetical protein
MTCFPKTVRLLLTLNLNYIILDNMNGELLQC